MNVLANIVQHIQPWGMGAGLHADSCIWS